MLSEGERRIHHRAHLSRSPPRLPGDGIGVEEAFLGLDRVARFRDADAQTRQSMLADGTAGMLAESWRIECCGIDYCARMALTAEDDERRLFGLVGADEARHAGWLAPGEQEPDSFNRFIAGLAETGTPQALAFLPQAVLEGFGITHYSGIAAHCRDAGLGDILHRLSQDEAQHHAAGLAVFRPDRLTRSDQRFLADARLRAHLHRQPLTGAEV